MMKRFSLALALFLLFGVINVQAQDKPAALIKGQSATVANNLVKIEIGIPSALGISYEKKLAQNISLYSMIGFWVRGGGGVGTQSVYGVSPFYQILPQVTLQPRFYHNLSKRAALDKNIIHNSANYVGMSARFYHLGVFYSNSDRIQSGSGVFDVMLSYGLQRSFFKRLNWDMAIQPGIEFYDGQAEFFIGLNLQLGVVVFSK